MKTRFMLICSACLLTAHTVLGSGLTLKVSSGIKTARIGKRIDLTLKMTGSVITNIVDAPPGAEVENRGERAFCYNVSFAPKTEGACTFGPYSLSLNGQSVTSEAVTIHVLPKWNGETGTFFRIDRDKIILGEDIELVAETWGQNRKGFSGVRVSMKIANPTNDYECTWGPTFNSLVVSRPTTNAYGRQIYDRQTWLIKPKKVGTFSITKDMFEPLPEGVEFSDLYVTVSQEK